MKLYGSQLLLILITLQLKYALSSVYKRYTHESMSHEAFKESNNPEPVKTEEAETIIGSICHNFRLGFRMIFRFHLSWYQ